MATANLNIAANATPGAFSSHPGTTARTYAGRAGQGDNATARRPVSNDTSTVLKGHYIAIDFYRSSGARP